MPFGFERRNYERLKRGKKKQMSHASLSICFNYTSPEGWNETVSYYMACIFFAPWVINIIYSGVTLVKGTKRTSIMNIMIFWFFWYILWRLALIFQWERPLAYESFAKCKESLFNDVINIYAFPDPNFISVSSFALSFIIIEKDITAPKPPPSHYLLFTVVVVGYSFAEWFLMRAFFYQIILNIVVSMLMTLMMIYVLQDLMEHFRELRNINVLPTTLS